MCLVPREAPLTVRPDSGSYCPRRGVARPSTAASGRWSLCSPRVGGWTEGTDLLRYFFHTKQYGSMFGPFVQRQLVYCINTLFTRYRFLKKICKMGYIWGCWIPLSRIKTNSTANNEKLW